MRMSHFLLLFLLFYVVSKGSAQIISQFSWDHGGAATFADVGPNGISVSTSAISDVGGVDGTNGLNAGLPKLDIILEIPGSPTFDVDGIDVSFDYQREEASGTFFQRGSSLIIRGCANLSVTFRVDDGAGSFNTVNSGNVYSIPNDDTYRTYRFTYLPLTGEAELSVNGAFVWSNDGPDNRNLYWTGSGNVFIGNGMDGTGFNDTFLDNLTIGDIFDSPLPIELLHFDAEVNNGASVKCDWSTASERNNDFFNLERSADGMNWSAIGEINGAINSTETITYDFIDYAPLLGLSYYRLKQVDLDGKYSYSDPVSVLREIDNYVDINIYPNPANDLINIQFHSNSIEEIGIYDITGRLLRLIPIDPTIQQAQQHDIDVSDLSTGSYYLKINNTVQVFIKN
jgi:hypothetical protein